MVRLYLFSGQSESFREITLQVQHFVPLYNPALEMLLLRFALKAIPPEARGGLHLCWQV